MQTKSGSLYHWERLSCLESSTKPARHIWRIATERVYLGTHFPNIYWTRREAQCVYYLSQLKRRKLIAMVLGLSIRTIDFYLESAKAKVDCHSQQELLDFLVRTDFWENIKCLNLG